MPREKVSSAGGRGGGGAGKVVSPQRPPSTAPAAAAARASSQRRGIEPERAPAAAAVAASSCDSDAPLEGAGSRPPRPFHERLAAFYAAHNPSCIASVPMICSTYAGREEELMRVLVQKYGAEPEQSQAGTGEARGGARGDGGGATATEESPARGRWSGITGWCSADRGDTVRSDTHHGSGGGVGGGGEVAARVVTSSDSSRGGRRRGRAADTFVVAAKPNEVTPAMLLVEQEQRELVDGAHHHHHHPQQQQQQQHNPAATDCSAAVPAGNGVDAHRGGGSSERAGAGPRGGANGDGGGNADGSSGQPAPRTTEEKLRERVVNFYRFHNPVKINEVDMILAAFSKQPDALMHHLVRKYGPEPPPPPPTAAETAESDGAVGTSSASSSAADDQWDRGTERDQAADEAAAPVAEWRSRFTNFFQHHCPEKLMGLEERMRAHRGREAEWMALLVSRYGPEPGLTPGQEGGGGARRNSSTEAAAMGPSSEVQAKMEARPADVTPTSAAAAAPPSPLPPLQRRCRRDPVARVNLRARLVRFFDVREPELREHVDTLLDESDEDVLFAQLCSRYGPEPSEEEVRRARSRHASAGVAAAGGADSSNVSVAVDATSSAATTNATSGGPVQDQSTATSAPFAFLRSPSPPSDLVRATRDVAFGDRHRLSARLLEPERDAAPTSRSFGYHGGEEGAEARKAPRPHPHPHSTPPPPPRHHHQQQLQRGRNSASSLDEDPSADPSAVPSHAAEREQQQQQQQQAGLISEYEEVVLKLSAALEAKTGELEAALQQHHERQQKLDAAAAAQDAQDAEIAQLQRALETARSEAAELRVAEEGRDERVAALQQQLCEANGAWEKAAQLVEESNAARDTALAEAQRLRAREATEVERLKSTVAVREHQCRMLRMQFHQLRGELEMKEANLAAVSSKNKELQGRVTALLSEVASLQLELSPESNPEKFYEIVGEIQSAFKTHYEQRIAAAEDELTQYFEYAREQVKNREQLIDELSAKIAEDTQEKVRELEQRRQQLVAADSAAAAGGSEGSKELAEEVGRLKTALAVQQEEHKSLLQMLQARGAASAVPLPAPPSLHEQFHRSIANQQQQQEQHRHHTGSRSSSAVSPSADGVAANVQVGTSLSLPSQSQPATHDTVGYDVLRQLKQRIAELEAESRAAKGALNAELVRQVKELNTMHERIQQQESEKRVMRQQMETLAAELARASASGPYLKVSNPSPPPAHDSRDARGRQAEQPDPRPAQPKEREEKIHSVAAAAPRGIPSDVLAALASGKLDARTLGNGAFSTAMHSIARDGAPPQQQQQQQQQQPHEEAADVLPARSSFYDPSELSAIEQTLGPELRGRVATSPELQHNHRQQQQQQQQQQQKGEGEVVGGARETLPSYSKDTVWSLLYGR